MKIHDKYLARVLTSLLVGVCLIGCNLLSATQLESIATITPVPIEPPVQPPSACKISGTDLVLYTGPGEFYEIYESVPGTSEWHPVATAAGWFKIPVSGGFAWLPSNHIFSEILGCDGLPQETVSPPVTACVVTNNTGDFQAIRQSAAPDAQMVSRFPPGASMPVLSKQGTWYEVYIDGLNLSGFIEESLVTTNAACAELN